MPRNDFLGVIATKVANGVKRCFLTKSQSLTTQTKRFPLVQINAFNNIREAEAIYPYGYFGVAPKNCQGIVFNALGSEDNQCVIAYDAFTRITGLQVGEVATGNQIHQNFIKFTNDGTIHIYNTKYGDLNIQIPNGNQIVNIDKNSTIIIGGNVTQDITGNVTNTIGGNLNDTVTGTITFTATGSVAVQSSSGNVTIQGSTEVQLAVGGATLTLTAGTLVSSVPISAPGITMTGAGNAVMNGGSITGVGDMTTQAGKSFNNHVHASGSYEAGGDSVTGTSGTLA